ncbi:TPA: hypothetical protein ACOXWE_004551 [Salmonella enterica]
MMLEMKLAETHNLPEADQKKVNAIMALAEPLGVAHEITVIFYTSDSIQVEWRNERNGQLIHRDFTFARDFISDFQRMLKNNVRHY